MASLAGVALSGHAFAIERHTPEGPQIEAYDLPPPNATPAATDDTPLGAFLKTIVVLGPNDAPVKSTGESIDTSRVAALDNESFRRQVQPFVGSALSRKLIAEIEAAIASYYRTSGFPFVSVSTPPQEITSGVLQLRVIEFKAGDITVSGTTRATPEYVVGRVRVEPGSPIDSRRLSEDIEWLNRNPYRNFEAVFSPGSTLGVTNLELRGQEAKHWRVYGGYNNYGGDSTGRDRYFVGATIADFLITDLVATYQMTTSRDFWYDGGDAFGNAEHPAYLNHSGVVNVPLAARSVLELVGDFIETNEANGAVDVRTQTLEGSVGYRGALSDHFDWFADVSFGIEAKSQNRESFFNGASVASVDVEIYQAYFGLTWLFQDQRSRSGLSITAHVSPGDIGSHNTDAALAAYTNNRVDQATYGYVAVEATRLQQLHGDFALALSLTGQGASGPLPDTEQVSIGGARAVRGYKSDDGDFDSAIVVRSELLLPPVEHASGHQWLGSFLLQPFIFADAGIGWDQSAHSDLTIASTGVGTDFAIGNNLSLVTSVGYALLNGPVTKVGDWGVDFRATARY